MKSVIDKYGWNKFIEEQFCGKALHQETMFNIFNNIANFITNNDFDYKVNEFIRDLKINRLETEDGKLFDMFMFLNETEITTTNWYLLTIHN